MHLNARRGDLYECQAHLAKNTKKYLCELYVALAYVMVGLLMKEQLKLSVIHLQLHYQTLSRLI